MQKQTSKQSSQPQVHLSSREVITRMQIDSVLQVFGMTTSVLGHFSRPLEEGGSLTPLDSELKIELENTARNACERLQKILADEKRWGTEFQDRVEKVFEESAKMQLEILEAQRAGATEVASPHFRYRPAILKMVDGSYCAFLGDINHMEQGIVGVGDTPAAAIQAFDDAFRGVKNKSVLAWLKEREETLEQGTPQLTPFPVEEQNEKLDKDGNRKTEGPPSEGGDGGTDSGTGGA